MSRAQLFEAKVIELEPIAVDGRTAAMILGGVCERTLYRLREQAGHPAEQQEFPDWDSQHTSF